MTCLIVFFISLIASFIIMFLVYLLGDIYIMPINERRCFWHNLMVELKMQFKDPLIYVGMALSTIVLFSNIMSAITKNNSSVCPCCGQPKITSTEGENK